MIVVRRTIFYSCFVLERGMFDRPTDRHVSSHGPSKGGESKIYMGRLLAQAQLLLSFSLGLVRVVESRESPIPQARVLLLRVEEE